MNIPTETTLKNMGSSSGRRQEEASPAPLTNPENSPEDKLLITMQSNSKYSH